MSDQFGILSPINPVNSEPPPQVQSPDFDPPNLLTDVALAVNFWSIFERLFGK